MKTLFLILSVFFLSLRDHAQSDIFQAMRDGNSSITRAYIEAGKNLDTSDIKGNNLVILASYYSQDSLVKMLVNAGAQINSTDLSGNTALMGACFHNDYEMVNLLVKLGAKINQVNANLANALHFAVTFASDEIVQLLKNNGINTEQKDRFGSTPKTLAIVQERENLF